MGTGMVIFPIIPEVSMTWLPKVAEFPLDIPASDPLKFHVDLFGGLGDNFIIDEAVCCFVVRLDGSLWLGVIQFFKRLVHGDFYFGIQK